jgi:rSAM/selenodomain-associated transferase 2
MISVVIPTLNAAADLPATLTALVPAAAGGFVREVVVADGGSCDATIAIADAMGCRIVHSKGGRGPQLAAGALAARAPWLLFLHADTVLSEGWEREARHFIETAERAGTPHERAAAFRFAMDSFAGQARVLERLVALRCALFAMPYGDQGLLMSRAFYDALGGYRPVPLMEDVDMVRRIGRRRLTMLRTQAITSPVRYERDGYVRRSFKNLTCLAMYFVGVPPERIVRRYES